MSLSCADQCCPPVQFCNVLHRAGLGGVGSSLCSVFQGLEGHGGGGGGKAKAGSTTQSSEHLRTEE